MLTVVILAGGMGTRMLEKGDTKPKPLVPIGEKPILAHIIDWYAKFDISNFVIATGYLGHEISSFLQDYSVLKPNLNLRAIDTGIKSQTGERIRKVLEILPDQRIFLTYGDGLSNVDINELLDFHLKQNCIATVTAVRPPARFGRLTISGNLVEVFAEKKQSDESWINGGFFVLERNVLNYLPLSCGPFESLPLCKLAEDRELAAYKHEGFWHPMDTRREQQDLEKLWSDGNAPWAIR